MSGKRTGALGFNTFFSLIILVPSGMLLIQFLDTIDKTCASTENTVILAMITASMVLLSLMSLMKGLLME